jgi:hypothetical protein
MGESLIFQAFQSLVCLKYDSHKTLQAGSNPSHLRYRNYTQKGLWAGKIRSARQARENEMKDLQKERDLSFNT